MGNLRTESGRFVLSNRRRALLVLLVGLAAGPVAWQVVRAHDNDGAVTKMRWDLIHITSFAPLTVYAGGEDSAKANNGTMITLTGTGTFLLRGGEGVPNHVTGGGTWETFDPSGKSIGSGTYQVISLVSWEEAPGSTIPGTIDHIGNGTGNDNRGGLLVLRIEYSDGSKGVLEVSCHLPGAGPPTTPDTVFEGITATMGYASFWNRVAPVPNVDGNRTLFHVLPGGADDDDDHGGNDHGR